MDEPTRPSSRGTWWTVDWHLRQSRVVVEAPRSQTRRERWLARLSVLVVILLAVAAAGMAGWATSDFSATRPTLTVLRLLGLGVAAPLVIAVYRAARPARSSLGRLLAWLLAPGLLAILAALVFWMAYVPAAAVTRLFGRPDEVAVVVTGTGRLSRGGPVLSFEPPAGWPPAARQVRVGRSRLVAANPGDTIVLEVRQSVFGVAVVGLHRG